MALPCLMVAASLAAGGLHVPQDVQEQVRSAERAFAKTMADRDLEAFSTFVSDEAVFFGGSVILRGRGGESLAICYGRFAG